MIMKYVIWILRNLIKEKKQAGRGVSKYLRLGPESCSKVNCSS